MPLILVVQRKKVVRSFWFKARYVIIKDLHCHTPSRAIIHIGHKDAGDVDFSLPNAEQTQTKNE